MPGFFGFTPSADLLSNIETALQKKNSKEALYPLRDQIALQINDEIIDHILLNLVQHFPANEKRDTAEKLAGYVKVTSEILLKQLLGKAGNDVVRQSIDFSANSLFKNTEQQVKVGVALDAGLITNLKNSFTDMQAGTEVNRAVLCEQYKQFADACIRHFMIEFNKTLDLGMIKRKVSDVGIAAVTKAVHIAIDKLIPSLNKDELKILAECHDPLFFYRSL